MAMQIDSQSRWEPQASCSPSRRCSDSGAVLRPARNAVSKLTDDSPLVRSLFEPPSDIVCPITLEIFTDPVSTSVGQVYEKSAILGYWRMAGATLDPLTRELLISRQLTPIHLIRCRAFEYRERVARACIDLACSHNVYDPARYLRRAVELVADMGIQVTGLDSECIRFIQQHPNMADNHLVLRRFLESLYQCGQADAATGVLCHLLPHEPRRGQAELIRMCCNGCRSAGANTDEAVDKLVVLASQQDALSPAKLMEVLQEAEVELQLIMKLCERLLVDDTDSGLTAQQRKLLGKYVSMSWTHLERRVSTLERSAATAAAAASAASGEEARSGGWRRLAGAGGQAAGKPRPRRLFRLAASLTLAAFSLLEGRRPTARLLRAGPLLILLNERR